ncbi:MAG TPA: DUF5522 domain-containing protein [Candidatus Eremiobacteraceae bacterium]
MNAPLFCPRCMSMGSTASPKCAGCGATMLALLDDDGALTREFLAARGSCCGSGCKNCPYSFRAAD